MNGLALLASAWAAALAALSFFFFEEKDVGRS